MVRHPTARRYLLRLLPDGTARLTIPRGGTVFEARDFAERNTAWLENQLQRLRQQPRGPAEWEVGKRIWFRGGEVAIQTPTPGWIQLGEESVPTSETAGLRAAIQAHFWRVAARELPPRVLELACLHKVAVTRVSVRDQRSRWGSCSRRGTISLNWRLIQTPGFVSDYVILHELMHRRQMNHSPAFWGELARVCPEYPTARAWLKLHAALLR
jgi:predicted metal-dependent hydrolase